MTVRWKPLLVLSGVFVLVAMGGLLAFALIQGPGDSAAILARARAEAKAGRFGEAEIEFKRAIQVDGKDPTIQAELADLYTSWQASASATAAPETATRLRAARRAALIESARLDPERIGPRRTLLEEALNADDHVDAVRWAAEVIKLDPLDPSAHYVRANERLAEASPNLTELRRHLECVTKAKPTPPRAEYLAARIAQAARDGAALKAALVRSRSIELSDRLAPVDAMAVFRLRALDVRDPGDPSTRPARVDALVAAAESMTATEGGGSGRVEVVGRSLEGVVHALRDEAKGTITSAEDRLEGAIDAIFRKAIAPETADLSAYFRYADHLRFRDQRARCLEVIDRAFRSPAAIKGEATEPALQLHALAVHATLSDPEDKDRFDKAGPHIKAILDGSNPRLRALGHYYQGQGELERLNAGAGPDSEPDSKAWATALEHLKAAADGLPDVGDAQARYGVGLILRHEPEMGRVYLEKANRLGNLQPRDQIWAAWVMVHRGYPEYAEPIAAKLLAEVEAGRQPKAMAGLLHLLMAEVHQARKTPADLNKAVESYGRAFKAGQKPTGPVQLRLAQIEVMLGRTDAALKRLDAMDRAGQGTPDSEILAVNTLRDRKPADAAARLARARSRYPRSAELISLEVGLLVADRRLEEADRLSASALAAQPGNLALAELRTWVLADGLDRLDEARAVLAPAAAGSDRTSPMVQLAQLDLRRHDLDAAAATVARIRSRWKDASVADLLDAQIAQARGNSRVAAGLYDAALKKDPSNKLIQFWKAQLDATIHPEAAARALESLARDGSVKEVDGVSLMTAAQSSLANLELQGGDLDAAIARFQGLLKATPAGGMARDLRWKLVAAQVAKRNWPAARAELKGLLSDRSPPPTAEERVAAAIYFRNHSEPAEAETLVSSVLEESPAHPFAVTVRAQMRMTSGRLDEARALLRRAIAASPAGTAAPVAFYLLAAAVENEATPVADALPRALKAVDEGLAALPRSIELVQAKCRLLGLLGRPGDAIRLVTGLAEAEPSGPFPRLLVALYQDARDYPAAERVATRRIEASPDDAAMVAARIRIVAATAIEAKGRGDRASADAADARTAALIREARSKFPTDPIFPQLACERSVRKGEIAAAIALTEEIDRLGTAEPVGALLRARIYGMRDRPREVVAAYAEAIERSPRRSDLRVLLAQAELAAGDPEKAARDAAIVLDVDPENEAATLIRARARAFRPGSPGEAAAGSAAALADLAAAIKRRPGFADAYHLVAEIHARGGAIETAVAALRDGLKAVPTDEAGLSIAIRLLCSPRGPGRPVEPASLDAADALAREFAGSDATGGLCLAAAIGFHRTGQPHRALPWAARAAERSDLPTVHLNFGDLLLTLAERARGPERDGYLRRALVEFDRVIKDRPADVDAVNNKAWILHAYLNRSAEALALAEGLVARVDAASLPPEFWDTLGDIQAATGRPREAEASFRTGLDKAPDLPILNFHMGKLMANDPGRSGRAATYLDKALAARDRLSPEMAAEVADLAREVAR